MLLSASPSFFLVEAQKPNLTSTRHSAFLLATPLLLDGWYMSALPRRSSVPMPKQSSGCVGASTQTETIPLTHFDLAAALARLGKLDEARAAVNAGLALDPRFTIRRFRDLCTQRQSDVPCRTRTPH